MIIINYVDFATTYTCLAAVNATPEYEYLSTTRVVPAFNNFVICGLERIITNYFFNLMT